jgi:hypothetical protein
MPRAITLQTNFNSGELDPRLGARTDVKQYYQGAAIAKNVLSMPQGGIKRRPGMGYKATLAGEARMASFSFNTEQTYLMVFTNNQIEIFKDGVSQATVTTTYTTAQLFELNWTQSADTMIIVHEDHQPAKLVRGSTHTSWTLSNITFKNHPAYDFDDDYSALTFTLGTSRYKMHESITVTASGAVFEAKHVGGIFEAYAAGEFGVGRITAMASSTSITVKVLDIWLEDAATSPTEGNVLAGDASIGEPVWSSTKGYPKTATFFQGRFWFGGSTKRPQTIWGSVTNDFFNFDQGSGLDDESIAITLDTDQVNAVTGIFAARHLQIFTSGGEFYMPDAVITPEKSSVKRQSLFGSSSVRPRSLDGATLFLDRTGKSIREFVYTYTEDAYTSTSTSLLASHLLSSPVDMDVSRGTSKDDANYLYLVNDNGTMAVFNMLRNQEVSGWTQWVTSGSIEAVCVVVDDVYFVTKRTINGSVVRFLEMVDVDSYTDANERSAPGSATVTGLDHLDGEECRVKADGAVMPNATPTSGNITLSRSAQAVEVGLDYDTLVKTMPLNMDFQNGPTLMRKKRIIRVMLDVHESLGLHVDGTLLPDRALGVGILNNTPTPYTGLKDVYQMGWSELAQVEISQTDPVPMLLLGVSLEMEA